MARIYDKDFHPTEAARLVSILGATNADLARWFNVTPSTIQNWVDKHPEFDHAIATGKIAADFEVANSLFKQATGYEYTVQEARKVRNADGSESTEVVDLVKTVKPSVTAATKWLETRKSEAWGDPNKRKQADALQSLLDRIEDQSRGLPSQHAALEKTPPKD